MNRACIVHPRQLIAEPAPAKSVIPWFETAAALAAAAFAIVAAGASRRRRD